MFPSKLARLVVVSFAQFSGLLQSSHCFMFLLFFKSQQCLLHKSHNIRTVTAWQKTCYILKQLHFTGSDNKTYDSLFREEPWHLHYVFSLSMHSMHSALPTCQPPFMVRSLQLVEVRTYAEEERRRHTLHLIKLNYASFICKPNDNKTCNSVLLYVLLSLVNYRFRSAK